MNPVENFISEFQNLHGTTVAEKTKNLFLLLSKNTQLHENTSVLKAITQQLTPKTHLEQLYYVDFLIYFHRYEELCNEFITGTDIVVSKIAREKWFFEKLFSHNLKDPSDFVNKFLPNLSYNIRTKILKKLVTILSEDQSDQLFDALHNRYGVFVATNILISCSCPKIEYILKTQPIQLWTSQLKQLYKKKPDLIYVYLEERFKLEGNSNFLIFNSIINFIAAHNPEMFCHIQEEYKINYSRIGKRCTKKIVKTQKSKIVAKPEVYVRNLKAARLTRYLGRDFEQFYAKLFPRNAYQVFWEWNDAGSLMRHYPKKLRFPLFKNTFDRIFDDSLETFWSSVHNDRCYYVLDMITDSEERAKWARVLLDKEKSDNIIKYFKAQDCMNMIERKLNPSVQLAKRNEYIRIVVDSCFINRDWETLLKMCAFVCNRLRNDDQAQSSFLKTLDSKNLNNLNESHWNLIKQIVGNTGNYNSNPIMFKYFAFSSKNGNLEEEILKFIKKSSDWTPCLNNLKNKEILLLLVHLAPQIVPEMITVETLDIHLILAWKNMSPGEAIRIFDHPRLIQSVRNSLNDSIVNEEKLSSAVHWLIFTKIRNEEIENLTILYLKKFDSLASTPAIHWLLKNRPELLIDHFETLMDVLISQKFCYTYYYAEKLKPIWRIIKCYSHLQLDQKSIEYCLNKLESDEFQNKINLIEPLSQLLPVKDYTNLIEKYKPTTPKVDLLDDQEKEKFQFQRNLLKSLVKLNEPETIISAIFQFLNGDFVASCVSPLHSCLYRIPENRLKPILDKLSKSGPVSVKKHGFYFVCETQDTSTILSSLKLCHLSQSIAMTYQHFVKNPSDLSWELLKSKLTKFDNNDHFTCLVLVNRPAPNSYKSCYFEAAFQAFRTKQNKFTNVLVDKLQGETIGQLSDQFFADFQDQFFKLKRSEFIFSYYLLHGPDTKFEIILNILRIFKEQNWTFRSYEAREKLGKFIETFFTVYMDWEGTNLFVITTFTEGFQQIFRPEEVFQEFVTLSLMQFKNQTKVDFAKSLLNLYIHLTNSYGKSIVKEFADCVQKALKKFYNEDAESYEFICLLFESNKSVENAIFVSYLLPKDPPKLRENARCYFQVINLLQEMNNEVLSLHLNMHFNQDEIRLYKSRF